MSYEYQDVGSVILPNGNVAFSGIVLDNHHNIICHVYNHGDGGCNWYTNRDEEGFRALIQNSLEDYGSESDPIDAFIEHLYQTQHIGEY